MRAIRWLFVVAVVLARGVSAQVVSGVVVLPDGTTPAVGVIIVASDVRGVETARALSNARGEFALRLSATGRVSLKALRIGFRPTTGPSLVAGAGNTEAPPIVLGTDAVSLATVNVRDRETCRVGADTGLMVARVWEEARKAMLSTQLGDATGPLFAEWIEYDQTLDSSARVVRAQRVRTSRNPTTHAFRSRPAAYLDTAGYVVADNGIVTYYAPDAEVLLSDVFAAGHCFRLVAAPRERPEQIGVAFQPTRDRRERREIEGTLWLDRRTAELRTIEFRFTNLNEVASSAGAGGRVEFLRLAEGGWLVSRWSLRMPQLESRRSADVPFQRTLMATRPVLRALQITGGEVTRVLRGDTAIYAARGPRVAVQIVGTDSLVPADGASLVLEGTDYRGTADRAGRIEITPVLAGRYRARVLTALMDSLDMPPVTAEVEARTEGRVDTLRLPLPREVLLRSCPRDSVGNGEGMVLGVVRDERARPVPQATVVATWMSDVSIIGNAKADQPRYTERSLGTIAGNDGAWRICGVPRQALLTLRVVSDSGRDLQKVRLQSDFAGVALVAHRGPTDADRELAAALGNDSRPTALVELSVSTPQGIPLADVNLEVRVERGATRVVVTGPSGKAFLPDVAPGLLSVRARRIGFKQGDVAARVDAGRNTVPIVLSEANPPALDTVRVVGDRVELARHDEFETRRRRHEATVSITREEIVKRNPANLWQMLMNIPSLKIIDRDGMVIAVSTRTVVKSIQDQGPCHAVVMIDGQIMNPDPDEKGFDLRNLPAADEIHGIEVFAGASSIPVKYGGTGSGKWCAMIAVWTR